MFYSASPESNVVGATADLLLEIDEAQDVAREKFDRDFRPMSAVKKLTHLQWRQCWFKNGSHVFITMNFAELMPVGSAAAIYRVRHR